MSQYFTLEGTLTAKNEEMLEKGLAYAKKQGWIDEEDYFVNEKGEQLENDVCVEDNEIYIPKGYHRNITYLIDKLTSMGFSFEGVGYTTDGEFKGLKDGKSCELNAWAKENKISECPDIDKDPEGYSEWQDEVGEKFMKMNR